MMNVPFTFRGLMAPVFTPFSSNGELKLDIVPSYANYLAEYGIKGILVNGTSGEGTSMNLQERKSVAEAWSQTVKFTNQHLMVQIGGACLPDVIELAKHAESIKANSILCLPELYFKPNTLQELIDYLKTIAQAAPNTPLLYYHIPSYTNVNIHMGQFLESVRDEIPTFVGIKFTSTDLVEGSQALHINNNQYVIFLGCDQLISAGCALGINCFIATSINVFPKLVKELIDANNSAELLLAKKKQEALTEAVNIVSKYGNWVQTMKHAMKVISMLQVGPPRNPLKQLPAKSLKWMEEDLKNLKYIN
ncbi:N-acetylneuraminate lyase-like [Vespa velutina]|uniref:N-acetylneuraminate lyase-like n=1 Tax=Vespa velutina TaxID=202808 RepID=UPI001FB33DB9|nr:N-acetylneuraminate lyase-like [Vespa velutina]